MNMREPLQLLLIEDDDNHAKIILRYLRNSGDESIEVHRAISLEEGFAYLSQLCFQAILLDLRLPDSDINDTLKKTLKKTTSVPIVILSTIEDKHFARKMIHEGAQDYICKTDLSKEVLIRSIFGSIERKRIEENLKASEARNSKIIEGSLDSIISINEMGRIIEFNPAAEKIFGYKRVEVLNREMAEVILPEKFREAHRNALTHFLYTGQSRIMGKRVELTALRKNGVEFPVEISISFMPHNDRQIITGFIRDITEQKRATAELNIAKEAAEVANLAKSSFLANMSHEIRTPLGIVLGYSELLANSDLNHEEKSNFICALKRNGELLSNIINDILDLSKVEAGKLELNLHKVSMSEILTDTQSLLKLQASEKGIIFKVSMDELVPPTIYTDVMRLRQILVNIIGNAIKFTQKGLVEVKIKLISTGANKSALAFIVTDTGRGISKEQAARLFTPFSQADISTTRKFGGSGLGLVLAKRLAQMLGGDVVLTESELDKGCTFTITIDTGTNLSALIESPEPNYKENVRSIIQKIDGMKILLAEDSKDNQLIVSRILTTAGAAVDIVENGKEAIETLHRAKYDLVLMDLQMPIMDGYEATAQLRKEGFQKPIFALTAHALNEEREHCLACGFNNHISKPINRTLLLEKLSQFCVTH
jgi:PAS domain S-box-containing protein